MPKPKELEHIRATERLADNTSLLNLSEVGRRLDIDVNNLRKTVKGIPDTHRRIMKVPKRCLEQLGEIMRELQLKKKNLVV